MSAGVAFIPTDAEGGATDWSVLREGAMTGCACAEEHCFLPEPAEDWTGVVKPVWCCVWCGTCDRAPSPCGLVADAPSLLPS